MKSNRPPRQDPRELFFKFIKKVTGNTLIGNWYYKKLTTKNMKNKMVGLKYLKETVKGQFLPKPKNSFNFNFAPNSKDNDWYRLTKIGHTMYKNG